MPMPLWWAKINKRVFNPRALRSGKWKILTHVGRSSGKVYRTPLDAVEVDGTYVFILVYGSRSDWVRNIFAAGGAGLKTDDGTFRLASPRIVTQDIAREMLTGRVKLPPRFLRIDEYLQMDIVSRESVGPSRT